MKPIYKPELFKKIRKQHFKETAQKRRITAPRDIEMVMNEKGAVTMTMTRAGVVGNMQSNSSCFEGWSLALKRWVPECTGVLLLWQDPEPMTENESGHYQRFLFRAIKFSESISWFHINDACKKLLQESVLKGDDPLTLNQQGSRPELTEPTGTLNELSENQLEIKLVTNKEINAKLKNLSDATFISNQLPVGLFRDSVKKKNLIFTGGKSAVDIWGINKDKKVAKLFELKKAGSIPIGIITELLFYSFVVSLVQSGRVKLPSSLGIQDTQKVDGFLIGPEFHPLIDTESLSILNKELRNIPFPITIDAIIIEPDFELRHLNLTI